MSPPKLIFQVQKHLRQTTFETLKCVQQTIFGKANLDKSVKKITQVKSSPIFGLYNNKLFGLSRSSQKWQILAQYDHTIKVFSIERSSSSPRRFPGRVIPEPSPIRKKREPEVPEIHFPFDEDEVMAIEYRLCSINNLLKSRGFPGVNFIYITLFSSGTNKLECLAPTSLQTNLTFVQLGLGSGK